MLTLQGVTYAHPNKDILFKDISLTINRHEKVAIVGNNGTGKSTLLKLIAGALKPATGTIFCHATPYLVPQVFGQFNDYTIAQALGIDTKLTALKAILHGDVTEQYLEALNDDWAIEERCHEALSHWGLDADLYTKIGRLSGGQKTKVFLSGIWIHQPAFVLLDEPGNHLDTAGRNILYNYISTSRHTLAVVSHDKTLLNLLSTVCELNASGITVYGGNYDFYSEQLAIEKNALNNDLKNKEKALRKAKETERETIERQQKQDARGQKKQEKAGMPTIIMHTMKNAAEKSTSHIKNVHADKTNSIKHDLSELRKKIPDKDKIKIGFNDSTLHAGKILVNAKNINFSYGKQMLWKQPLNFVISSEDRIALLGNNGSGKTTLVNLLLGNLSPTTGEINTASLNAIYIDQDYSLIDNTITVYEQAQLLNTAALEEHELKSRLTHFLFTHTDWGKSCATLSGGERMKLMLCCLTLAKHTPDIIILDEPTNNIDMQNVEILTKAVNEYTGTVIVISHDTHFLDQIAVTRSIVLY